MTNLYYMLVWVWTSICARLASHSFQEGCERPMPAGAPLRGDCDRSGAAYLRTGCP
jgi:hypothetical protein